MKRAKHYLFLLGLFLAVGFAFDYLLYRRNAPTGVPYTPTGRYIALWPIYAIYAAAGKPDPFPVLFKHGGATQGPLAAMGK